MTETAGAEELVVLLDEDGRPSGTAPKSSVHHADTPLHLAFSCWVFDSDGRLLLTQRAGSKKTWPLAWTNTFCGHPAPDEPPDDAVRRRARQELGVTVEDLTLALPDFRYTARMPDGVMENEVCPVFVGTVAGPLQPDPTEVEDVEWTEWAALLQQVQDDPSRFSPWLLLQLPLLDARRGDLGDAVP
jgi:isopentenyl-diphosphate Delta-isomerase